MFDVGNPLGKLSYTGYNIKPKFKEHLKLGRIFNADILGLIFVLSYLLTAVLYNVHIEITMIILLFISGLLVQTWGAYNNDRLDLEIDSAAEYCSHKPLVTGNISIDEAKIVEYSLLISFLVIMVFLSVQYHLSLYTYIYISGGVGLGFIYNRYNKSNMSVNIVGQFYASFAVLIGMSFVVDFDLILFFSALVIGLNGIYLNIIEADLKDMDADIINVPKTLGIRFEKDEACNTTKFFILNDALKIFMFGFILMILILESINFAIICLAFLLFWANYIIRLAMFKNLSKDREEMKPYFAIQEFSSIVLIGLIYIIIHPLIPVVIILIVILWLVLWNKYLWGTYLRPQV